MVEAGGLVLPILTVLAELIQTLLATGRGSRCQAASPGMGGCPQAPLVFARQVSDTTL